MLVGSAQLNELLLVLGGDQVMQQLWPREDSYSTLQQLEAVTSLETGNDHINMLNEGVIVALSRFGRKRHGCQKRTFIEEAVESGEKATKHNKRAGKMKRVPAFTRGSCKFGKS